MAFFRQIIIFLFRVIAGLLLLLSLIVFTAAYAIVFLIWGEKAARKAHRISRVWASVVLFVAGEKLKVHNRKVLNANEAYVFISNHRSYLDIPTCTRCTGHTFKFLAKQELTKVPLLGYVIKNLYITVKRESMRDRVESMKKMKDTLDSGISVWIYPEGTRNKSANSLEEFSDGAFHLAVASGRPIAPLTIIDTGKILPPGSIFDLNPGKVEAYWDEPIPTAGLDKKDVPALREKVRQIMLAHFKQ